MRYWKRTVRMYAKSSKSKRKRYDSSIGYWLIGSLVCMLFIKFLFRTPSIDLITVEHLSAIKISSGTIQDVIELSTEYQIDLIEFMTYLHVEKDFFYKPQDEISREDLEKKFIPEFKNIRKKYKKKNVDNMYKIYEQIFADIQYFPIPIGFEKDDKQQYVYANTWGAQRTYGGDRKHLGIDIMDVKNQRDRIPIVSITDGIVKEIGWNERGGWRVGIKAPKGGYFYYAHLNRFTPSLYKGMEIKAGQLIGFMGDSGYSKEPGTMGNFPVHLHFGLCIDTALVKEEVWVNPYELLRYLENKKIQWKEEAAG